MKKTISLLLALATLLSFVSCGNLQNETTTGETEKPITTATPAETTSADMPSETTKAPVEMTAHTWNYPEPIVPTKWEGTVDEYFRTEQGENEFESFYTIKSGVSLLEDRNRRLATTASEYREYECFNLFVLVFRVLASENKPDYLVPETHYYVQIVDAYGDITYDPNQTMRIAFQGSDTKQRYGKPTLEIGEFYARIVCCTDRELEIFQGYVDNGYMPAAFPAYHVEEVDGKRYVYSEWKDLSSLECAIPITDPEENSIYKVGKHDKQIAELERLGIPLPTFDYKCELDAMYTEYAEGLK